VLRPASDSCASQVQRLPGEIAARQRLRLADELSPHSGSVDLLRPFGLTDQRGGAIASRQGLVGDVSSQDVATLPEVGTVAAWFIVDLDGRIGRAAERTILAERAYVQLS
jgi:hypothetical protein